MCDEDAISRCSSLLWGGDGFCIETNILSSHSHGMLNTACVCEEGYENVDEMGYPACIPQAVTPIIYTAVFVSTSTAFAISCWMWRRQRWLNSRLSPDSLTLTQQLSTERLNKMRSRMYLSALLVSLPTLVFACVLYISKYDFHQLYPGFSISAAAALYMACSTLHVWIGSLPSRILRRDSLAFQMCSWPDHPVAGLVTMLFAGHAVFATFVGFYHPLTGTLMLQINTFIHVFFKLCLINYVGCTLYSCVKAAMTVNGPCKCAANEDYRSVLFHITSMVVGANVILFTLLFCLATAVCTEFGRRDTLLQLVLLHGAGPSVWCSYCMVILAPRRFFRGGRNAPFPKSVISPKTSQGTSDKDSLLASSLRTGSRRLTHKRPISPTPSSSEQRQNISLHQVLPLAEDAIPEVEVSAAVKTNIDKEEKSINTLPRLKHTVSFRVPEVAVRGETSRQQTNKLRSSHPPAVRIALLSPPTEKFML